MVLGKARIAIAAMMINVIADVMLFWGVGVSGQDISILVLPQANADVNYYGAIAALLMPLWLFIIPAFKAVLGERTLLKDISTYLLIYLLAVVPIFHFAYGFYATSLSVPETLNRIMALRGALEMTLVVSAMCFSLVLGWLIVKKQTHYPLYAVLMLPALNFVYLPVLRYLPEPLVMWVVPSAFTLLFIGWALVTVKSVSVR